MRAPSSELNAIRHGLWLSGAPVPGASTSHGATAQPVKVLPYGPRGWLVELPEDDVVGYARAVARAGHPDVVELVPAARTVLVRLRDGAADGAAR